MDENAPRLPVELEREIFELFARLCPDESPALFLVARRVQIWIEPFLYHTLVLHNRKHSEHILALSKSRPPDFFASIVQRLVLTTASHVSAEILALCTGATHLAMEDGVCGDMLVHPVFLGMRNIQHLTLAASELPDCAVAQSSTLPVFASITHLTLLDYFHFEGHLLTFVAGLPALTHLALYHPPLCRTTQRFLEVCTNIRVLVLLAESQADCERKKAGNTYITDTARFAICCCKDWTDGVTVCEREAESYWDVAEKFLQARDGGVVKGQEPAQDLLSLNF
ncbi:hypothetical protein C8F01DRAFT_1254412 [Mycena amicta]|nr:hypothetical protein C8F01DRAFT_1254412 [Mycena amicta]